MRRLVLLCLLLFVPASADATTYYVDGSGGSGSASLCGSVSTYNAVAGTCTGGSSIVRNTFADVDGLLAAGDTLYIRGGTYVEKILDANFADGTAGNPITISAYSGETVIFEPVAVGGTNVMRLDGDYITIIGIIFDGTGITGSGGAASVVALGSSASHLILQDCTFRDSEGPGLFSDSSDTQIINATVTGNGTSTAYSATNGVYWQSGTGNLIYGGEFYNNECFAIRFYESGSAPPIASGNIVDGVTIHDNGTGYADVEPDADFCSSEGGGFAVGDDALTIRNSLIYNNRWGLQDTNDSGTFTNFKAYNNTFYNNDIGVTFQTAFGSGTEFKNNISLNDSSNLLTSGHSVAVGTGGGTGGTSNVTSGTVTFVDAPGHNFHLSLSDTTARDQGTTLASVTTDFDRDVRPQNSVYDIGADEYTSASGDPNRARLRE